MKIQAMLDWSAEEKSAKVKEWAQSLFTLRLQKATGQLENPMKIKQLRKDIARLKTALHMSAAETAAAAAHEVAHGEGTEETGAKTSANVKSAGAAKHRAHAAPSGKGAKKRAAAHKAKQTKAAAATGKKTAGASAKAHSPYKKSSAASGKVGAASKSKSASSPKARRSSS